MNRFRKQPKSKKPKESTTTEIPNIIVHRPEEENIIFPDVLSPPSPQAKPKSKPESKPEITENYKEVHINEEKESFLKNTTPIISDPSIQSRLRPGVSSRYDFKLEPSKMALIIIDIQEFLSSPTTNNNTNSVGLHSTSYLFETSLPASLPNISNLATSTRNSSAGGQVIFTYLEALTDDCRDVSLDYKLSGPQLAKQLPGPSNPATFLSQVAPDRCTDIMIPKTSCSVFLSTNIDYVLRNLNVEQVVLCGQLTNQCVESAARDAADLGYLVTVVSDACAALSPEDHERGLYGMKGFSRIISTKQVLAEIQNSHSIDPVSLSPPISEQAASPSSLLVDSKSEAKTVNTSISSSIPNLPSTTESDVGGSSLISEHKTSTISQNEASEKYEEAETSKVISPVATIEPSTAIVVGAAAADSATEPQKLPPINHTPVKVPSVTDYAPPSPTKGAIVTLLRTLQLVGVKFLRVGVVDLNNSIRCKAIPIKHLLAHPNPESQFPHLTSIAEVCFGGLPSYADALIPETGLTASRVLYLQPDLSTLRILPYAPTHAFLLSTAHDPLTGRISPFCTRSLLARVQETARNDFGIQFNVGAELEFQLFSKDTDFPVDSSLFAHATTLNQQENFVSDLIEQLEKQHIETELVHSECAGGQLEVVLKYQEDVLTIADNVVVARETIINCARKHGNKALFLPKSNALQAGNGLHLHFSFSDLHGTDPKRNAFVSSDDEENISRKGQQFMEGILQHLPALLAVTTPTTNSFRRFGQGCWTGHKIGWATEDKESPLRVCLAPFTNEPRHVELKLSDSTANIYLGLAAVLTAGLDGISRNLILRPASSTLTSATEQDVLPSSLTEALLCLESDHLLIEVLGTDVVKAHCALRRAEIAHEGDEHTLEKDVKKALERS